MEQTDLETRAASLGISSKPTGPTGGLTSLGVLDEAVLGRTDQPDQQVLPGRVQVGDDDVIGGQLHAAALLDLDMDDRDSDDKEEDVEAAPRGPRGPRGLTQTVMTGFNQEALADPGSPAR